MRAWLIPALALVIATVPVSSSPQVCPRDGAGASVQPLSDQDATDVVSIQDFPEIGKWMLDRLQRPAEWLGRLFKGKALREPINVILIDGASLTPAESMDRLTRACEAAGYPARFGHSGGYWGSLGGRLFPQIPSAKGHAFANEPFEFHNNHGRLFGPLEHRGQWLYIGAFSREKFDPLTKVEHLFVSFVQAREDFAGRLSAVSDFKRDGHVELGNALTGHPSLTTGDHDGQAAVLRVKRPPAGLVP